MSTSLSYQDKVKIMQFEMAEAKWVHEEVIRPRLYPWINQAITDIVEKRRYGMPGRIFHFCIEYFYVSKILKIRIKRNKNSIMLGGKGYRPGYTKMKLASIRSTVLKQGKEIATKTFPLDINQ